MIQFSHELGKDVHAPGYYLHIDNERCFLAAGIWHPPGDMLRKIRERIVARSADWRKVVNGRAFRAQFELQGQSLKRPPRGFAADSACLEDLQRKDFIAVAEFPAADISERQFVSQTLAVFRKATPLMVFLCAAAEVEF